MITRRRRVGSINLPSIDGLRRYYRIIYLHCIFSQAPSLMIAHSRSAERETSVAAARSEEAILAIDQGTTNSKAVLVSADGSAMSTGAAPVGVNSSRPGWIEQE